MKITPSAIPSAQTPAIAESSRTSCVLLAHSTPKAESTEKTIAIKIGFVPR